MNPPTATIVIPLLNQVDDWLEQCVDSALRQTVPAGMRPVFSVASRTLMKYFR